MKLKQYFHNFLTLLKIGEVNGKATFNGAEVAAITDSRINEKLTSLVAANGGTCGLDMDLGRSFLVDASALVSGNACTISFLNIPTGSKNLSVSIFVKTGASLSSITWPAAGTNSPSYGLTVSKTNRVLMESLDAGVSWSFVDGGVR